MEYRGSRIGTFERCVARWPPVGPPAAPRETRTTANVETSSRPPPMVLLRKPKVCVSWFNGRRSRPLFVSLQRALIRAISRGQEADTCLRGQRDLHSRASGAPGPPDFYSASETLDVSYLLHVSNNIIDQFIYTISVHSFNIETLKKWFAACLLFITYFYIARAFNIRTANNNSRYVFYLDSKNCGLIVRWIVAWSRRLYFRRNSLGNVQGNWKAH